MEDSALPGVAGLSERPGGSGGAAGGEVREGKQAVWAEWGAVLQTPASLCSCPGVLDGLKGQL